MDDLTPEQHLAAADEHERSASEHIRWAESYPAIPAVQKTVYKYEFVIRDTVELVLPRNSQVIHFAYQNLDAIERLTAWAIVNPHEEETETHTFLIRGTGHPFTGAEGRHRATVLAGPGAWGNLVWHIFEVVEEEPFV